MTRTLRRRFVMAVAVLGVGVAVPSTVAVGLPVPAGSGAYLPRQDSGALLPPLNSTDPFSNSADSTSSGHSSNGYYYNQMGQFASAAGAAASFTQSQPKVGPKDFHSLTELAVATVDLKQVVEVGVTVDRSIYKDSFPHLFVAHWIDGNAFCSNGCGFVPTSKTVHAGQKVAAGQVGTFSIQFKVDRWLVGYDGATLGYFPASQWGGTFKKIQEFQVFGEVLSSSLSTPHSQMGNGIAGTKPGSAVIKNARLIGGTATKPFVYHDREAPAVYKEGNINPKCITNCGMSFGGPGY